MRLKRVCLENVCQFRHLDHTFHPGLTGIVGPNGSGKSNLTKAIFFALTGTYRNAGVKADNIGQVPGGRRSGVALWLEHAGVEMEIRRGLAGVKTRLRVGAEEVHGDVAVTERVMEVLGADVKMLGEYVFILQLHMADFIEATPGDRARVFQKLFGADEAEAVNRFAAVLLDKELVVVEQADLAEVRARVAANQGRMDALLERLERLDAEIERAAARAQAAGELVAAAARAAQARRQHEAACLRLDAADRERGQDARDLEATEAELAALEDALLRASAGADSARVLLATWAEVEARRGRASALALRRERLERAARDRAPPPPAAPPPAAAEAELKQLYADQVRLSRLVRLHGDGLAECPTCGQAIAPLGTARDLEEALGRVRRRIAAIEAAAADYRRSVDAKARWEAWQGEHLKALADLAAQEADLGAEAALPAVGEADLRGAVDHERQLRAAAGSLRGRRDGLAAAVARHAGACEQLDARRRELEEEIRRLAVAPGVLAAAEDDLARVAALRADRQRAEGEADGLARTLEADEAAVARFEALEARNALTRALRAGMRQVAEVTHRGAAPRLVSEAHLEHLIDDIDEYLGLFGSDFRVRLGPGLSFVADFADGRAQAGGRLSEGQKGVLALAFWVAVNSLFARQVGFLSLDEPTASLDQHNVGALEVALRQLRGLSRSLGLQCLLVTHESSLAGLFDDVLPL